MIFPFGNLWYNIPPYLSGYYRSVILVNSPNIVRISPKFFIQYIYYYENINQKNIKGDFKQKT